MKIFLLILSESNRLKMKSKMLTLALIAVYFTQMPCDTEAGLFGKAITGN